MFLYKLHDTEIDCSGDEWLATHPSLAKGHSSPTAGDTVFVWTHEVGLIAECFLLGYPEDDPSLTSLIPIARYSHNILNSDWLSGADRKKMTLRSKILCFRHSRIWQLSENEVVELDQARRTLNSLV